MTISRIVSIIVLSSAVAASAAAQPAGPGPIGPGPAGFGPIGPPPMPSAVFAPRSAGPHGADLDDRADDLYDQGREAIEDGKYDRALDRFTRLIELKGNRTDATVRSPASTASCR